MPIPNHCIECDKPIVDSDNNICKGCLRMKNPKTWGDLCDNLNKSIDNSTPKSISLDDRIIADEDGNEYVISANITKDVVENAINTLLIRIRSMEGRTYDS